MLAHAPEPGEGAPVRIEIAGYAIELVPGDAATKLRYYWFLETKLDGIPVIVTRTGWTGEVGYEVYLRDAFGYEQHRIPIEKAVETMTEIWLSVINNDRTGGNA